MINKKALFKNIAIFTGKLLCWSLFLILWNFQEHLFWKTSGNSCFWYCHHKSFNSLASHWVLAIELGWLRLSKGEHMEAIYSILISLSSLTFQVVWKSHLIVLSFGFIFHRQGVFIGHKGKGENHLYSSLQTFWYWQFRIWNDNLIS